MKNHSYSQTAVLLLLSPLHSLTPAESVRERHGDVIHGPSLFLSLLLLLLAWAAGRADVERLRVYIDYCLLPFRPSPSVKEAAAGKSKHSRLPLFLSPHLDMARPSSFFSQKGVIQTAILQASSPDNRREAANGSCSCCCRHGGKQRSSRERGSELDVENQ